MSVDERLAAARHLAGLDTDALAESALGDEPVFRLATARFTPPESLEPEVALELERETRTVISLLEERLSAVAEELARLPRTTPAAPETGTRIDVSG